jgi:hypothetical protein
MEIGWVHGFISASSVFRTLYPTSDDAIAHAFTKTCLQHPEYTLFQVGAIIEMALETGPLAE